MGLNFGDNKLTDTCVKKIAALVKKYDCFSSLVMNKLHLIKLKDTGFIELANSLKIDKSLQELDIRENPIHEKTAAHFLKSLGENYVLCKIKLDIKPKNLPLAFTSYPVHSMFEFEINVTND